MPPRSLLLHCLLALALTVYGLPVAATSSALGEARAAEVSDPGPAPCHDPSPSVAGEIAPDCCKGDSSSCDCNCLHAAPLLALATGLPGAVPPAGAPRPMPPASAPRVGALPSLRPPIA